VSTSTSSQENMTLKALLQTNPEMLSILLQGKLSELRSWIAQNETSRNATTAVELQKSGSRMSMADRVVGARNALRSRQLNHQKQRQEDLKGSIELYWLSKWIDAQLQLMWTKLEDWEIERRLELHRWLMKKFMQILPQSVSDSYQKSLSSPGQLALDYTDSRSLSIQLSKALVDRIEGERLTEEELSKLNIAQENLTAAGTLSETELVFLYDLYKKKQDPSLFSQAKLRSQLANLVDFATLEQKKVQEEVLAEGCGALRETLESVKQMVRNSVDAVQVKGLTPQTLSQFQECLKICEQNAPNL
jgi:hypothetical protein